MRQGLKGSARFKTVVDKSGRPEAVTLWTRPERDTQFMSAVRRNRVMTVKQEPVGTLKDYGRVGFYQEPNVSYLVFPKSLKVFEGKRIVGIDYGLLRR